jgi:hypothetical protein
MNEQVPHFLESLDFARPPSKGSARSGLPTKVLEGASRPGTYALLRLTALRLREGQISFFVSNLAHVETITQHVKERTLCERNAATGAA